MAESKSGVRWQGVGPYKYRTDVSPEGRAAYVFRIADAPWRIQLEQYPAHTDPAVRPGEGWFGGKVLWSWDQKTSLLAREIAEDWYLNGEFKWPLRRACRWDRGGRCPDWVEDGTYCPRHERVAEVEKLDAVAFGAAARLVEAFGDHHRAGCHVTSISEGRVRLVLNADTAHALAQIIEAVQNFAPKDS